MLADVEACDLYVGIFAGPCRLAQRSLEAGADVLAWLREGESDRLLAAVNFATEPAPLRLGLDLDLAPKATLVVSTDPDRSEDSVDQDRFTLGPSEGVLLRL